MGVASSESVPSWNACQTSTAISTAIWNAMGRDRRVGSDGQRAPANGLVEQESVDDPGGELLSSEFWDETVASSNRGF